MKLLKWFSVGLAVFVAGCASDGSTLIAGKSTAPEVEATMGAPAEKIQDGADSVWFYPRQPYGRQTFAVRLGGDGLVKAVEQRLSSAYISRIRVGMTLAEVRRELGPPARITRLGRLDRDIWDYYARDLEAMRLWVQFKDGTVREVLYMADPERIVGPEGEGSAYIR